MAEKGFIFDIKRYSINDGPGIRTTVFFKGCPLKCWWCHNPESQRALPEIFEGSSSRWNLIQDSSNKNLVGSEISTEELMIEIKKDFPFYEESKGGVTFSGGEPMMQINFLSSLLSECKKIDINTAIDTTGYTDFSNIEKIYDATDIFLYDLKFIDNKKHMLYTGVSNGKILENLKRLCSIGKKVVLRIPIIPTITNTENNLNETINFISSLKNIPEVNLLPYHKSAGAKYEKMKMENKISHLEPPTDEEMNLIKNKFLNVTHTVRIGG
jgi:pyruvate formate lyase activating enzyme